MPDVWIVAVHPNHSKPATLSLVASAATERTTMEPGPETKEVLVRLKSKREVKEAGVKSERDQQKTERRQQAAQKALERKQRENEKAADDRAKAVLKASNGAACSSTEPVVLPLPPKAETVAEAVPDATWPPSRADSREENHDQADFENDAETMPNQSRSNERACAEASDLCQTSSEAKSMSSVKQKLAVVRVSLELQPKLIT